MRFLLIVFAFLLVVSACTKHLPNVKPVWVESTPPPESLPTPVGFSVLPLQAYTAVKVAKLLSLKHIWHIYADTQYYYVHDTFLGGNARKAFANGVRIDGKTGNIVYRQPEQ